MDAQQWNDMVDVLEFEPDKPSARAVYDFLYGKVSGRGYVLSDLGCGIGSLTAKLAPMFSHVNMIDQADKVLERGLREVNSIGINNVETIVADLTEYQPAIKADVALACACPPFYRVNTAPLMERFASKYCVLIMPTLHHDSPVRSIIREAGLDIRIGIDAAIIENDRRMEHRTESVEFFEKRENLNSKVMLDRCIRYTDGSDVSVKALENIIDGLSEDELFFERWSRIVCWEV